MVFPLRETCKMQVRTDASGPHAETQPGPSNAQAGAARPVALQRVATWRQARLMAVGPAGLTAHAWGGHMVPPMTTLRRAHVTCAPDNRMMLTPDPE